MQLSSNYYLESFNVLVFACLLHLLCNEAPCSFIVLLSLITLHISSQYSVHAEGKSCHSFSCVSCIFLFILRVHHCLNTNENRVGNEALLSGRSRQTHPR